MGHKIFVSYKYADDSVRNFNNNKNSTVRDYVDYFQSIIDNSNHINKGEKDDENLSELDENTIWEKLKNRIYDSTLTVVFISPHMKENKPDREQWIPWEISYSLKETKRKNESGDDVTSKTNAMLAVVLPDENNSYDYFFKQNNCCSELCTTHCTKNLFSILKNNMFNIKEGQYRKCQNDSDKKIWIGDCSYIEQIKRDDFISNTEKYIDKAYEIQNKIDDYNIYKEI